MSSGLSIRVRGTVQGVGFRPFVFRLAARHGLTGWVRNTAGHVEIEVDGKPETLECFLRDLRTQAPEIARIEEVETTIRPAAGYSAFAILISQSDEGWQAVSPDVATCDECLAEILNPAARRYRYPFTNCTNCGPRFTIIEALPYDRARTTMHTFALCDDCRREFEDPRDRRFHAQPIACPVCGPKVWLHIPGGFVPEGDAIEQCAQLLLDGQIVAIKGLGGFHLACDATNEDAVKRLRERKRRYGKPFAVMVANTAAAAALLDLTETEKKLLQSRERPIVVATLSPGNVAASSRRSVAPSVAEGLNTLGLMLPYTPLHHLLLNAVDRPLVMTSGNLSEEPIATGNEEALRRLGAIADAFLLHNRGIHSRYDDSVLRVAEDAPIQLRRARSIAPTPITLPFVAGADILAVGPQQKNTFCMVKQNKAFLSQHIGDLDNIDCTDAFNETVELYSRLFKVNPTIVAHDLHPDYYTTGFAHDVDARGVLRVSVQHHHAHVVSCMVEHHISEPVIGIAYDGTGYGTDGAIWGSEVLVASWRGFERAAHLRYTPLLGGEAAVRNPLRMAASWLWTAGVATDIAFGQVFRNVDATELAVWRQQFATGLNAPPTSSCGRLFDAVAALLGIRTRAIYEGQPAVELEAIADASVTEHYEFVLTRQNGALVIDPTLMFAGIGRDRARGRPTGEIAAAFHNTVAAWTLAVARAVRATSQLDRVCLSGGCFQNALLLSRVLRGLEANGFEVFRQESVPPNDGGVSLGQATVAWALTHR